MLNTLAVMLFHKFERSKIQSRTLNLEAKQQMYCIFIIFKLRMRERELLLFQPLSNRIAFF